MNKPSRTLGLWFGGFACLTWLVPVQVLAGPQDGRTPTLATPMIRDVALGANGRLAGQFVDAQGRPKANQAIILQKKDGQPVRAESDRDGRFAFNGLSGGLYQVATADSVAICRCWTNKTAPPAAKPEILVVSGEGIERGQRPIGELLFSAPVLFALVIAAAIAIPIAVHNSQDAS